MNEQNKILDTLQRIEERLERIEQKMEVDRKTAFKNMRDAADEYLQRSKQSIFCG